MADRDVLAALAEELGRPFGPLELALKSQDDFSHLMARSRLGPRPRSPTRSHRCEAPLATISQLLEGGELDARQPARRVARHFLGARRSRPDCERIRPSGVCRCWPVQGRASAPARRLPPGRVPPRLPTGRRPPAEAAGRDPARVRPGRREAPCVRAPGGGVGGRRARALDAAGRVRRRVPVGPGHIRSSSPSGSTSPTWARRSGSRRQFDRVPDGLAAFLKQGATSLADVHDYVVRLPLLESDFGPREVTAGVGMFPLPPTASEKPGFSFLPYVDGEAGGSLPLTDIVAITFEAGVDADGGIGILVRPSGVSAFASILSPPTSATAALALGVVVKTADGSPTVLAGSRDASRLEVRSASVRGGVRAASASGIDSFAEIALQGARIVVKPDSGDTDGFLATLLPGDGLNVDLALTVGLSSRQGVYFGGSERPRDPAAGARRARPDRDRGRDDRGARRRTACIPIELGATIKGELGAVAGRRRGHRRCASTSRSRPNRDGNLGAANIALGFKPPNGVGLSHRRRRRQGRRLPLLRLRRGRVRRRARARRRRLPRLKAIGLITTQDARRLSRLLAARHHHRGVRRRASSSASASR